jgi:murein DD-endopeptidase MepM/ murein hydrolase activator NlpD
MRAEDSWTRASRPVNDALCDSASATATVPLAWLGWDIDGSLAMQVLITHGSMAHTRVLHFRRWQLVLAALGLVAVMLAISGSVYHFVFLQAARERWPVVSQLVRWVVREDMERQERFMRENLDAMAQKVGEMQAKLVQLQLIGERVSGLAGVRAADLPASSPALAAPAGGSGGPFVPASRPSLQALQQAVSGLEEAADRNADILTLAESRLFESRLDRLLVPSTAPVDGPVGSGFGFRADPFRGRAALHTGLDYPADLGTPVRAAAGGVVQSADWHAEYGQLVVLDHGNGLATRYAHLSKVLVAPGDLVRRGQPIGKVGSSGRSTGPHLHFEVLVEGVPQNPARFLAAGSPPARMAARR